jgi:hypothetical protein
MLVAKKRQFKNCKKKIFLVFYKELTYIHIHFIIDTFSVVGSVPTSLNYLQKPLRHALHQAPEDLAVLHPQNPQPLDLLPQLLQVGGVGLLQLHLHPPPHILHRVEIRAVAQPFNELNVGLLCEPFGHQL